MPTDRLDRVARIIGGVIRQATTDAGAAGVVVLDSESPEGRLAVRCITDGLGSARVWSVSAANLSSSGLEPAVFDAARFLPSNELERAVGRVLGSRKSALLASPVNKTALLLGAVAPPEPLLPIGDLYASQVAALAGGWSAPDQVRWLADAAGGVDVLDRALEDLVDRRSAAETVLRSLPTEIGCAVLDALDAGRFARRRLGLVPKLSARTLGIDLFA